MECVEKEESNIWLQKGKPVLYCVSLQEKRERKKSSCENERKKKWMGYVGKVESNIKLQKGKPVLHRVVLHAFIGKYRKKKGVIYGALSSVLKQSKNSISSARERTREKASLVYRELSRVYGSKVTYNNGESLETGLQITSTFLQRQESRISNNTWR